MEKSSTLNFIRDFVIFVCLHDSNISIYGYVNALFEMGGPLVFWDFWHEKSPQNECLFSTITNGMLYNFLGGQTR